MSDHTPTPFRVTPFSNRLQVEGEDSEPFSVIQISGGQNDEICFVAQDKNNHKEDAEFIVRACNSHDAMLKLLESIRSEHRADNHDETLEVSEFHVDELGRVIAKAKGGTK